MKKIDSRSLENIQGGGWWNDFATGGLCALAIYTIPVTGPVGVVAAALACIQMLDT
jgi:hypothetical protein